MANSKPQNQSEIPAPNYLAVGDKAPSFSAVNQKGETVSLKDYSGKKVALCFYVNDGTKACDNELLNLQSSLKSFQKEGLEVIAVSKNTEEEHAKNAKKLKITFPMLADPDLKIIKAYKVWGRKNRYGREYEGVHRSAYIIDEKEIIQSVLKRVTSTKASEQILESNKDLGEK